MRQAEELVQIMREARLTSPAGYEIAGLFLHGDTPAIAHFDPGDLSCQIELRLAAGDLPLGYVLLKTDNGTSGQPYRIRMLHDFADDLPRRTAILERLKDLLEHDHDTDLSTSNLLADYQS